MEASFIQKQFCNIMEPQKSSYKVYLASQGLNPELTLGFQNFSSTVERNNDYSVLRVTDKRNQETESFLFNFIGSDSEAICLDQAMANYFAKTASQTVLYFKNVFEDGSRGILQMRLLKLLNMCKNEPNKRNFGISLSQIADDVLLDLMNESHTLLPIPTFSYRNPEVLKTVDIMGILKNRKKQTWQACIIRVYSKTDANETLWFNLVFLNTDSHFKCEAEIDTNIVNRSLTVIANCHTESPLLNCDFTTFMNNLSTETQVSVLVNYSTNQSFPVNFKNILFHTCFKYVTTNPLKDINNADYRVKEYVKKLQIKTKSVEQETRTKVVQELSSFYSSQYSSLKNSYLKAIEQTDNSAEARSEIQATASTYNRAVAGYNFYEAGDCCSKLKGLSYLAYETQRQITECFQKITSLKKRERETAHRLAEKKELLIRVGTQLVRNEFALADCQRRIRARENHFDERKAKLLRQLKVLENSNRYLQRNRQRDQEIIESNRREIQALIKYIRKLQGPKQESTMSKQKCDGYSPSPKMIVLQHPMKSYRSEKCTIKYRVDYKTPVKEPQVTKPGEFARIRISHPLRAAIEKKHFLFGKALPSTSTYHQHVADPEREYKLKTESSGSDKKDSKKSGTKSNTKKDKKK